MAYEPDTWSLGDRTFTSRFILGSGKFNLDLVEAAVRDAGAEIVTLAVRRANTGQDGRNRMANSAQIPIVNG